MKIYIFDVLILRGRGGGAKKISMLLYQLNVEKNVWPLREILDNLWPALYNLEWGLYRHPFIVAKSGLWKIEGSMYCINFINSSKSKILYISNDKTCIKGCVQYKTRS